MPGWHAPVESKDRVAPGSNIPLGDLKSQGFERKSKKAVKLKTIAATARMDKFGDKCSGIERYCPAQVNIQVFKGNRKRLARMRLMKSFFIEGGWIAQPNALEVVG